MPMPTVRSVRLSEAAMRLLFQLKIFFWYVYARAAYGMYPAGLVYEQQAGPCGCCRYEQDGRPIAPTLCGLHIPAGQSNKRSLLLCDHHDVQNVLLPGNLEIFLPARVIKQVFQLLQIPCLLVCVWFRECACRLHCSPIVMLFVRTEA